MLEIPYNRKEIAGRAEGFTKKKKKKKKKNQKVRVYKSKFGTTRL